MNPEEFNRIRRIIFCMANNPVKHGFNAAFDALENYYRMNQLDYCSYIGLKAELTFFQNYRTQYGLTPAGDMGDHVDFSGFFNGQLVRFDVTTNINYKKFATYEPLIAPGVPAYKIAFLNGTNFDIIDIYDLQFFRCSCGGYLIPIILNLSQNCNRHGEPLWSNDQQLLHICNECHQHLVIQEFSHHGMPTSGEYAIELPDNIDKQQEVSRHWQSIYNFFKKTHSPDIMAVGEIVCKPFGRDGDCIYELEYGFVNNAIAPILPYDIEWGADY